MGNQDNDYIQAGSGKDTVYGGQGNDTLVASSGTDVIFGNEADDIFLLSSASVAGSGDVFDGGEGNDTLQVTANNDLTSSTVTAIETVSIVKDVKLTASLTNLASVTALRGEGTIQITANETQIRNYINPIKDKVDGTLIILDETGKRVNLNPPNPDNPTDPDKERPVQVTFTLEADNFTFAGRANAPLSSGNGISIFNNVTLQSADSARGTGNSDVLTVEVGSNTKDTIIPVINPLLDGIETLNFTTTYFDARPQFNGSRTTGTNKVVFSDSTAGLNVQGLRNVVDVVLRNHFVPQGNNDTIINFNPDVTDNEIDITLENVRSPKTALYVHGGFNTFNITSTQVAGSNAEVNNQLGAILADPSLAPGNLRTVNITGDQSLSLFSNSDENNPVSSLPDEVVNINAGGLLDGSGKPVVGADGNPVRPVFTGDLSIAVVPNSNLTIIGGKGNDFFGFGTTLNHRDSVNGGEGEDVVRAKFDGSNEPPSTLRTNSVEIFELSIFRDTIDGSTTIPMNDVFGLNKIVFDQVNDNTAIAEITGITAVPEVEFKGNGGTGEQTPHAVSMNGTPENDTFKVTYGNSGITTSYNAGGIRTELIENLEVTVNNGNITFNPTFSGSISGDGVLRNITLISNNDVNAGSIISDTKKLATIDASGVKGKFVANSNSLADDAVVTVGQKSSIFSAAGNNNGANKGISINGQGGDDQLTAGNGYDRLFGAGGGDRLTGGDGLDTFVYERLSDSLFGSRDVITDFVAGVPGAIIDKIRVPSNIRRDLLDLGLDNRGNIGTATVSNIEGSFANLLANNIGIFNDGTSTYVIFNGGTEGYQAGVDSLIQLDGLITFNVDNFVF